MSDEIKDAVVIGDMAVDEGSITPSHYFDYVKGLKHKLETEQWELIIDNTLKMIDRCKITGQTSMAKELAHHANLALRELEAASKGFDIFVNRKDIESYIDKVEGKAINIIELSRYEREIPDDIIDKIVEAKKIFDEFYIIYIDYTKETSKKVAKERRDKDPILFGAFFDRDADSETKIYVEDRLFFIADWVEEKCDLTLQQIALGIKDKSGKDITYKVSDPKDAEEVKNYLNSFTKPIEEGNKPVSLFTKVKSAVRGRKKSTTTSKKRTTKKKEE